MTGPRSSGRSRTTSADGIGPQRIGAAGRMLYSGTPGDGAHVTGLGLGAVPEGIQALRLEADGDGTAGAPAQEAVLRIDRTPPVALVGLPNDAVRATVSVSDATSGVRDWTLQPQTSTYSRPVTISGRFLHRNGRGLRGATVYLVDPKGLHA